MGFIVLAQGFKLSVAKLDHLLMANVFPPNEGLQPHGDDVRDIGKLFKIKGADCEVKVFVPQATGYNHSKHVYVCCDWIYVFCVREIEGELQKPVPRSFENMRRSLGAESGVSRYIIFNEEDVNFWLPAEIIERNTAPILCGVCQAVFDSWSSGMTHRYDEHKIIEDWGSTA